MSESVVPVELAEALLVAPGAALGFEQIGRDGRAAKCSWVRASKVERVRRERAMQVVQQLHDRQATRLRNQPNVEGFADALTRARSTRNPRS